MANTGKPTWRAPSFFRILLDPSAPHLPLPSTFVKRHLKKVPQHPTFRLRTGKGSWSLKMKKTKGKYYLAHGWNKVVQDTHLGFGDFLVFWLIDPSTFQVSIYGPSGCQKDLSFISNKIMRKETRGEVGKDLKNDYEHPCFQKTISHKTHKYIMRLPKKFVAEAGIRMQKRMVVKDLEGREWSMKLKFESLWGPGYYLSTGWPNFRDHNKLVDGDICLFEFIEKEGKMNLAQVIKKQVPPQHRNLGPLPDTEPLKTRVTKRKTESPSPKKSKD